MKNTFKYILVCLFSYTFIQRHQFGDAATAHASAFASSSGSSDAGSVLGISPVDEGIDGGSSSPFDYYVIHNVNNIVNIPTSDDKNNGNSNPSSSGNDARNAVSGVGGGAIKTGNDTDTSKSTTLKLRSDEEGTVSSSWVIGVCALLGAYSLVLGGFAFLWRLRAGSQVIRTAYEQEA